MTSSSMVGEAPIWLRLVQLAIIFAVSAFSYYVVENPIRHGAIGKWVGQLRNREFTVAEWAQARLVPVAASGLFVVVAVGGLALAPNTQSVNVEAIQEAGEGGTNIQEVAEEQAEPFDLLLIADSVTATART